MDEPGDRLRGEITSANFMAPRNSDPPLSDRAEEYSPISIAADRDAPHPPRANLDQFFSNDWNPFFSAQAPSYGAVVAGEERRVGALIDQIPRQIPFGAENISEVLNPFSLSEDFPALRPPDLLCIGEKRPTPAGSEPAPAMPKREKSLSRKQHREDEEDGANSHKADDQREQQTHSRAKRGHAANSHSLAERLRREKISERMRFLQYLVPGCSKITGKAVMLDEIINYVQSLQRQVEFLSMKLATVSPELNLDIQRLLSQDILLLQAEAASDPATVAAFCPQFHLPLPNVAVPPEIDREAAQKRASSYLPQSTQVADLSNATAMGFLPGSSWGR